MNFCINTDKKIDIAIYITEHDNYLEISIPFLSDKILNWLNFFSALQINNLTYKVDKNTSIGDLYAQYYYYVE